ncbi:complement C1q-like protein 2 isoform X2 [Engraulis encrasicolus]
MRAAISLLVLLLSMCGVQTDSNGVDFSTPDVSELKELRDMMVDLRVTLQRIGDEADNVAVKERLALSETKVEALERALQDTKAEMKTEVDNLKKENAAQEAELTAVKTRLASTETEVENLDREIKAAPKVAFSAGLKESGSGYQYAVINDLNLVFKKVITNVGEAYSSATGFFTAPVRGVYYFRFTVMDDLYRRSMYIRMHKNGQQLMSLREYDTDGQFHYLSGGLTLQLEKGDRVNLMIPELRRIYDSPNKPCTFSGFLLFPL